MRNAHYKTYSFRLNEQTIKRLRELKQAENTSYNLLFVKFIKKRFNHKKHGKL